MSERLALFWFRYKYVVAAVVVAAIFVVGFVTSGGSEQSETEPPPAETTVPTISVETLLKQDTNLNACLQNTAMLDIDRRNCAEEVPYGVSPLILLDDSMDTAVLASGDRLAGADLSFADALSEEMRSLVQHGVAVDLDNDGNQEILLSLTQSPGEGAPPMLVLTAGSDGFTEATKIFLPQGIGAGDDPWSVEPVDGFLPGDWNGDGWVDVIAYRKVGGSDRGAILLVNEGAQAPGELRAPNTGSYPSGDDYTMFRGAMRNLFDKVQGSNSKSGFERVTSADVDDDGWVDAIFLTRIGALGIVRGGPDFYPRTEVYTVPGAATDVLVADFDGDQREDIAVAVGSPTMLDGGSCTGDRPCDVASDFPNGGVLFFSGRDEGKLEREPAWDVTTTGPVHAVAAVDTDNDGALELVVGGRNLPFQGDSTAPGEAIKVFAFSDGSFTVRDLGDISVASTERIFVGDFNGDGTRDIVSYGRSSDAVQLVTFPTSTNDHIRVIAKGSASAFKAGSNDSALGAVVSVSEGARTFAFTVGAGSNTLSRSTRAVHLGLGTTDGELDLVTVTFPLTGKRVVFRNVPVNTILVATEPDS